MRLYHVAREQVLTGIVFGDNPGQQIALRRDHFAVFVGVLVEQRRVGLLDQTTNFLVQATALFALNITIVAVLNVGARQLFMWARHQLVFDRRLDLIDIHLTALIHLLADDFCDGGAVICVIDSRCFSCTQNGFFDAL
ncbi:hypothetical protein D3C86_1885540 [compost metagenome]